MFGFRGAAVWLLGASLSLGACGAGDRDPMVEAPPEPAGMAVSDAPDAPGAPGASGTAPERAAAPARRTQVVTAGQRHACALVDAGVAYCWGIDYMGQLGQGERVKGLCEDQSDELAGPYECARTPLPVQGGPRFISLSAGRNHSCGLTADGAAYCWGDNNFGELGTGADLRRCGSTEFGPCHPVRVAHEGPFVSIAARSNFTCALDAEGAAYCWGYNFHGVVGHEPGSVGSPQAGFVSCHPGDGCALRPLRIDPPPGGEPFIQITAGEVHACAIAATGRAYCWGDGSLGAAGPDWDVYILSPREVDPELTFRTISAGGTHTCAVSTDGAVLCWGMEGLGQLGNGSTAPLERKGVLQVVDAGDVRFASVAAGGLHTCALAEDGQTFCWGRNDYGQLGAASAERCHLSGGDAVACSTRPLPAAVGLSFVSLAAGDDHTCGITAADEVYCWGRGDMGQLGGGGVENGAEPVRVALPAS